VSPADRSVRALLSGERRGPIPSLLRAFLLALTPLYRLGLAVRGAAYRTGLRRVRRAPVPVVSVGNLTAGGTGKSPFVVHVVRRLEALVRRPAVVSRGYRARPGAASDEAEMIRRAAPGVLHVEDPVRLRGAGRAAAEGADVVVLDDGFQHRACARDLDIVLVDAGEPFGFGHLLPRGLLREPPAALSRADLLVLTRVDQVSAEEVASLRQRLSGLAPGVPILATRHRPAALRPLGSDDAGDPAALAGRRVLALSGLARPGAFERTLRDLGADVVAAARFPDHHDYAEEDLAATRERARAAGATAIVATTKDAVKLEGLEGAPAEPVVLVLEVDIEILEGAEILEERLARLVGP
jgi:tetraacyldisaccharide 4'-kinase